MVIHGFVLAGGASKRMGQDKANLLVGGKAMGTRVAEVLKAGGCESVTIVGKGEVLKGLGFPVLLESRPEHHPLFGVAAAMRAAQGPYILIAPCDLVNLDPETVRQLLAKGTPCVASGGARIHPLLAVLPVSWSDKARTLAETGAPAAALVASLERIAVTPSALFDANRPSDLDHTT